jgi:uncharacterized 2Fe-2S/4Fe-4S cluster protein (DUF4445 family)
MTRSTTVPPGKPAEAPGDAAGVAASRAPTLFDRADELAWRVPTSCRRTGRCHECIVEVTAGAERLSAPTEAESFLRPPFRLACQAELADADADIRFAVVRRRLQIVEPEPYTRSGPLEPMVYERDGVILWGDEPIAPARTGGRLHGIALDVGTTTVVFELVDLVDGRSLEVVAIENPQRFGGSDVMNRISYDSSVRRGELRYALRKALGDELRELYRRHGLDRRDVLEIVVVGNSTMRDLFFGLDVAPIGERPYQSTSEVELRAGTRSTTALVARAHELGLWAHPQARVWGAPLIAGHVGADVGADIVAAGLDVESDEIRMLVDVGTNTEVVLVGRGRMLAASCPAGPAFEGGDVTFGMQATDGAIERVRLAPDGRFAVETIGGVEPRGLCGSGLIDLLAELRRADVMSAKGVFAERARELEIVPAQGITFSRADASALAQAKAANTVGQQIVMRALGVDANEIDRVLLAGGFARHIDVASAIAIGFLPPVRIDRVTKLGNASLRGARELLLSTSARARLEPIAARVEHIELETSPDFFDLFVDGCQFKPMLPTSARTGAWTGEPPRAAA